ncbi:MAG TPA: hypothetical protein VKA69_11760, partial [Desulfobacteria bacterium]|nr:hypothetical protein [Desulfobacteria bacterium]
GRIYADERPTALNTTTLVEHTIRGNGCRIAKISTGLETQIYRKLELHRQPINTLALRNSKHVVYYQEACRYWLKAVVGLPYFKRNGKTTAPPHGRFIYFQSRKAAQFVRCLLNSSLFYWYYSVFSDCEHVNDQIVRDMPIPNGWSNGAWSELSKQLSKSLARYAIRKVIKTKQGHTIEYDEMKAMLSKNEIDEIDSALATYYGFTDEELDFIINYDIKYRMGIK